MILSRLVYNRAMRTRRVCRPIVIALTPHLKPQLSQHSSMYYSVLSPGNSETLLPPIAVIVEQRRCGADNSTEQRIDPSIEKRIHQPNINNEHATSRHDSRTSSSPSSVWDARLDSCSDNATAVREVLAEIQATEGVSAPTCAHWNTLLRALSSPTSPSHTHIHSRPCHGGQEGLSLTAALRDVMAEMRQAGRTPDATSWTLLLRSCTHAHTHTPSSSSPRSSSPRAGKAASALVLREAEREGGVVPGVSVSAWAALLQACAAPEEMRRVFREMVAADTPPDVCCWNILLNAYAHSRSHPADGHNSYKRSRMRLLRGVLAEMAAAGVAPDVTSWTTLLKGASGPRQVRAVMTEMQLQQPSGGGGDGLGGVTPNVYTWSELVKSYPQPQDKRAVLQEMKTAGVQGNAAVWSTLLRAYATTKGKRRVFKEMRRAGVQPDVNSYNCLLKAYRRTTEVREVMGEMQAAGVVPDVATWNTLMSSYSEPADLRGVMQEMQGADISPDVYSWNTLIKSYEHPPQIRTVMEEMRAAGVEPNVATWALLMRAHKQPLAVQKVIDEMLAADVAPDSVSYSILFNSYLKNGGAREVIAIFESHLKESPGLINNYIVTAVVRALAAVGSEADIMTFWDMYKDRLSASDLNFLLHLSLRGINIDSRRWHWVNDLIAATASSA